MGFYIWLFTMLILNVNGFDELAIFITGYIAFCYVCMDLFNILYKQKLFWLIYSYSRW